MSRWRSRQRGCTQPNRGTAFPWLQGTSAFTKINKKSPLCPVTSPGSRSEGFPWLRGKTGQREAGLQAGATSPVRGSPASRHGNALRFLSFFFFSAQAKFMQCNCNPVCRQVLSGCCAGPATPRPGPRQGHSAGRADTHNNPYLPPHPRKNARAEKPCAVLGWGSGNCRALTLNPVGACAPAAQVNPLPWYHPAPGEKGEQVRTRCSLGPAAVPTGEKVPLARDAFPGNNSSSSSFAWAGQCSSGWDDHSTQEKRGLRTPCPLPFHHKAPAHPSTSAGHTERPAVTLGGGSGQGGWAQQQEEAEVGRNREGWLHRGQHQLPACAEQQQHHTDPFSN